MWAWVATVIFTLVGCTLSPGGTAGEDRLSAGPADSEPDVVWFSRYTMQEGGLEYVAVDQEGLTLYVSRMGQPEAHSGAVAAPRTGRLGTGLRDRLFQAAAENAVYATRVEGPGEILFYPGVLLRIGSRLGSVQRGADQVPFLDLPHEIRRVLDEVSERAEALPPDPDVGLLISAELLDPDRAQGIRTDPRGFYRFVALLGTDLESAPALTRALDLAGLLVVVPDADEVFQIDAWLDRSNPDRVGSYFFLETSDGVVYQVHVLRVGPP